MHEHSDDDHHSHDEHEHGHSHDHHDHSSKFLIKLIDKKQVAEGTMAFSFERPAGLEFKPGQHAEWTLINPPETDAEGNSRMFSLASSPSEQRLTLATRMRDTAFKRVLGKMNTGDTIQLANPHGSFTLHGDSTKPAVFLIGGIGITPVFSIIKNATEKQLPHKLFLFYSNRRPEDAPFLEQLTELANQNHNFRFVPTMTEPEKSAKTWNGETGYIDRTMIEKYVIDIQTAIYYLSGPEAMVAAMRKVLASANINDDNIKTEEFSGY